MLRDIIVDPYFPDCPIRNILSRISDRWSMLILYTLDGKDTAMRYSDILAAIPDISQKMLTVAEYSITERGKSLMPHINSLIEWALANLADILNDRKNYSSNKNH